MTPMSLTRISLPTIKKKSQSSSELYPKGDYIDIFLCTYNMVATLNVSICMYFG